MGGLACVQQTPDSCTVAAMRKISAFAVHLRQCLMGYERVVGYRRVSTDEQGESGAGLAAQTAMIEREVAARSWELVRIDEDVASGKTRAHRHGLDAALETVRAERCTLMVAKLDRLSRSLIDFALLMADAQRKRWNLVALDLGVDLSTPAGEFLASVMASAAQWERRIIGQRTSDALQAKKAAGKVLGRPDRSTLDTISYVAKRRTEGASYNAIARELDGMGIPPAQGGRRWYASSVRVVEQRASVQP